ncbi:MAG: DUF1731 domain-containing protein [Isosphaeraceae bacterium]
MATGQRVLPRKALDLGYSFKHPEVAEALKAIFATPKPVAQAAEASHGLAHASGHH